MSNFGQGLKELDVGQIFALTPEAKGRVERLWNTMQDRLPGELRLLGITDIDGTNNVLPRLIAKHNEKFAVLPTEHENVCVKPVEKIDLDFLFARRQTRKTDGVGSFHTGAEFIPPVPLRKALWPALRWMSGGILSGKIWAVYKGRRIEMAEIERPERATPKPAAKSKTGEPVKAHKPAPNHPWKRSFRKKDHPNSEQDDTSGTFSLATYRVTLSQINDKEVRSLLTRSSPAYKILLVVGMGL